MRHEQASIVLVCDIDDTLLAVGSRTPAEQAQSATDLARLGALVTSERSARPGKLYFGTATGRSLASQQEREWESPALAAAAELMNFSINAVGSAITLMSKRTPTPVADWPQASGWSRGNITGALLHRPELSIQSADGQSPYKVSYYVHDVPDEDHARYVESIGAQLFAANTPAEVLFSGGRFLDILPAGVNKGTALKRTVGALAVEHHDTMPMLTIAAGDSMNDRDLLAAADKAIIPANGYVSLKRWAADNIPPAALYIAQDNFAGGIIEGYRYFMQP